MLLDGTRAAPYVGPRPGTSPPREKFPQLDVQGPLRRHPGRERSGPPCLPRAVTMRRLSRSAGKTARAPPVVVDRQKGGGGLDQGRCHLEATHREHTTPTAERGTVALRGAGARPAPTWPRTPSTIGMKVGPRWNPGKHGKSLAVVCPPRCSLPPRSRPAPASNPLEPRRRCIRPAARGISRPMPNSSLLRSAPCRWSCP